MRHVSILILLGLLLTPVYAQKNHVPMGNKKEYCVINKQTTSPTKKRSMPMLQQELLFIHKQQTQRSKKPNIILIQIRQF